MNSASVSIQPSAAPRALYVLVVVLTAALMTQIIHEATHALAMVFVGTGVDRMQLYAVLGNPVTDMHAQRIIAGSAALVNIAIGLVAVVLFYRMKSAYYTRLLLMYLAAYMLMAGFGYLFVDALFYAPDATFHPDWQFVIHSLGGGWEVRLPILAIGVLGLLAVFFWLPNAALRFVSDPVDKQIRQRELLRLTLLPYIVVNLLFTLFGLTHPLGAEALGLIIFPYWFGYVGLFWAFFIGGMWTDVKARFADAARLTTSGLPLWVMGVAALWIVAGAVLLVGLEF
jgi:hypothetical protein